MLFDLFLTVKFYITEFLGGQPIKFLMFFRNFVQFLIGYMDVILIIHLLKFGLHQFFFFVHIFNNPISRIDSGSEGIQDSVIVIVGIFLRLSVALKVATSALLFLMLLRYVGHSYFMCLKP